MIAPVDIAELQRSLNAIGLNTGAPDGKSGARTQEMVKAIQLIVGEPPTGEATPALLESLRQARPSAQEKAKSLFTLAAAASQSRRFGDAIRLYQLGLTFAPANPDGLLALGNLYRDRNDYEGARRLYELLQKNGGSAADRAREQLAALPRPSETPAGQTATVAPDNASTRLPANAVPPQSATPNEPGRLSDGTYVGSSPG